MDTLFLNPLNKYRPLRRIVDNININLSRIEYGTERYSTATQCSAIINMLISYVNLTENNAKVEAYFSNPVEPPPAMTKNDSDVFMAYFMWMRNVFPTVVADDVFRFDAVWTLLPSSIRNDVVRGLTMATASKNKNEGNCCRELLMMLSLVYNPFKLRYVFQLYLEELESDTVRSGDFEYIARCITYTISTLKKMS